LPTGESLRFVGGSGVDSFSIKQDVTFAGGLDIQAGDGANTFVLFDEPIVRLGALPTGESIKYSGGPGSDFMQLHASLLSLKGSLGFAPGNGTNSLLIEGNQFTAGKTAAGVSLQFDGGTDQDVLNLEGSMTFAGSLMLDGAAGADLIFSAVKSLKIAGDLSFNGGTGVDTFNIQALSLQIAKALTIQTGDDSDNVFISADGSVGGDATLALGGTGAGPQSATVQGRSGLRHSLAFKGAFSLTSTSIVGPEFAHLLNLSVAKALSLSFGDSVSTVNIDNLLALATLDITTGEGADVVRIERENFAGNSVITKLATIQTGTEGDTVLIGAPAPTPNSGPADSTRVRFLGGLTLLGGGNTDTTNAVATENDFPTTPPTITDFEVTVL
jgi:hypothetical protein